MTELREEGNDHPTTYTDAQLVELLLQVYARSCDYPSSRPMHDRWVECRDEVVKRLTSRSTYAVELLEIVTELAKYEGRKGLGPMEQSNTHTEIISELAPRARAALAKNPKPAGEPVTGAQADAAGLAGAGPLPSIAHTVTTLDWPPDGPVTIREVEPSTRVKMGPFVLVDQKHVGDEEFEHDVMLTVSGDFADDQDRGRYMQLLLARLNGCHSVGGPPNKYAAIGEVFDKVSADTADQRETFQRALDRRDALAKEPTEVKP